MGQDLTTILKKSTNIQEGAIIFGYPVNNPSAFGVVEFDKEFRVISLEEKPSKPKSHFAIPGIVLL